MSRFLPYSTSLHGECNKTSYSNSEECQLFLGPKWGPNKAWPFRIGLFWGMFPKTKDWKVKIHKQFKSYGIPRNQPSDHPENTTWSCGACRRREPWRVRPRTNGWCNNGVDEGHDHDKDHHNGNNKGNKLPCWDHLSQSVLSTMILPSHPRHASGPCQHGWGRA